ncbi:MAG: hypothetical protein ABJH28_16885 [Paraglaciecola sp.]|uniref:hypothetical protein n=1 Tax=Paraglaciecola sp. TaxID=1920173 RepID=UPI003263812C
MEKSIKVALMLAFTVCFTAACTNNNIRQVMGSAVANGADTQVKYSAFECTTLQQRCVQGEYQEWQTSDKELGCSCKKL